MNTFWRRTLAVVETVAVTFAVIPFLTLALYRLFPRFETWQVETLGFPFPVFVYVVEIAISVLVILIRGKSLATYGLSWPTRDQLDVAATCFFPVVMASVPLGMGVDHKSWDGALILAAVQVALLFLLGWMLRKKPTAPGIGLASAGMLLVTGLSATAGETIQKAVVLFLTYALFVGFGEEILYRGYVESRLNEVWGRPYRFFGVPFGWGVIVTALIFGLTHVGILRWILDLSTEVTLAWGFWTVFGGLVFSLVREKSGSIVPGALLHGLPQAIATVAMLFL